MDACLWPTRCTPVALGFKGSEWGSKLGPVANNAEWPTRCTPGFYSQNGARSWVL